MKAQAAGAWVVDASAAFRADVGVPIAFPAHPVAAPAKGRIVRCASPVAAALVPLLEPLRQGFGVSSATVSALLAAGAAGSAGIAELERQTVELMSGREPEGTAFPHRLAFNVIPQVGAFEKEGFTGEEVAWSTEIGRLWPDAPRVVGTAFQVPGFFGHTLSIELQLQRPATVDALRAQLQSAQDLKLVDVPLERIYPMPMLVSADQAVLVGRVRIPPGDPDRALFVAAFEGARRAALAAVDAAESIAQSA
jgi:aspartate-semialdehyde dehydrogenase